MLAIQNPTISKISLHSHKKSQNRKMSPSTHTTESPHSDSHRNDFTSQGNYWDQSSESRQIADLQRLIENVEKQELQMEAKFQQCIENMLAEIERNNDSNARLAAEVNLMKQELTQSKKDILIVEEYMKANIKKETKSKEISEPLKVVRQSAAKNGLVSCSSAKNLLLKRSPSKYFKSKLLPKQ